MEKFTSEKKKSAELSPEFKTKSKDYKDFWLKNVLYFNGFNTGASKVLELRKGDLGYEFLNSGGLTEEELEEAETKTPITENILSALNYIFDNKEAILQKIKDVKPEYSDLSSLGWEAKFKAMGEIEEIATKIASEELAQFISKN